jgi:ribosome-binding protein aMBF1 (putative translation factor)
MITGQQIKAARELLGWAPSRLAQRAKLHSAIVQRAESVAGEPPITLYQQALIRNALERFGVEFTNGNEPGVKLRKTPTSRR